LASSSNQLLLPAIEKQTSLRSTLDFYGAMNVWQKYCGITKATHPKSFRSQHGWCVQERQAIDPILLIQEPEIDPERTYLVARKDEEAFLESAGIRAKAIGLPYVYSKAMPAKRRPGSLLVMPAHSLEYTRHEWKFDAFAQRIQEISDQFSEVVCCVHPACQTNGYWKPNFERLGIPCVMGADVFDRNGLVRIKTLMNQFEFMTTNVLGSHVVYAAAAGVKVSIFGDYAEYREEDYQSTEFYQLHPHVLRPVLDLFSESHVRSQYPSLFCDPIKAQFAKAWADTELGLENRLSPQKLRQLLGWDRLSQLRTHLKSASRKLTRRPERLIKSLVKRQ
jgi:hypothetical protein